MPDFSSRSSALEIMDDLNCSGEVVEQTLRELDYINKWLGGDAVTLQAVDTVLKKIPHHQEIILADLGCGSGKMLEMILDRATEGNRKVKLIGIDANPTIVEYATRKKKSGSPIVFLTLDIFSEEFKTMKFDIVIGTLFFHHFSDQQLASFFKQLTKQTRWGIIVNDIHRHPLAYFSIKWLTRIFSKSSMVKYDAPLSVLRAFKKGDWNTILAETKLSYSLKWKWAFRWQLIITTNKSLVDSFC